MDARIQALKDNCESSISTLRVHLEMEISKLTKPILELTMGQFIGEFHGDPLEYFKRTMAMQVDAASGAARRPVRRLYGDERGRAAAAVGPREADRFFGIALGACLVSTVAGWPTGQRATLTR